jgi:Mrp family chromosome partitioning ATPase
MGRTLDVLKRAVRQVIDEAAEAPASMPEAVESEDAPEVSAGSEMPYIEVGARGKAVDASPSVLVGGSDQAGAMAAAHAPKIRFDSPMHRPPLFTDAPQRSFSFRPGVPAHAAKVAAEIITYHEPENPVSKQYRALLPRIQESLLARGPYIMLFTAITPGAGTTTTVLNLAVASCADVQQRVLVVDANLARPAILKRLGMTHPASLAEVLTGAAALEQALAATSQARMHVLAAAQAEAGAPLLREENVRWLRARLRERFDLIFVDGPAWEGNDNAAMLATMADVVLLVVDAEAQDNPAVRKVTRALARRGCRLGGLILAH